MFFRYGNVVLYGEGLKRGIFYDWFHVCVLCFDDIEIVCEWFVSCGFNDNKGYGIVMRLVIASDMSNINRIESGARLWA